VDWFANTAELANAAAQAKHEVSTETRPSHQLIGPVAGYAGPEIKVHT
jgi:hypothetical protein